MAPKPPTFGTPRHRRGAPLYCACVPATDMGAPRWPPSPQRSARPGTAVAPLRVARPRRQLTWGPRDGPKPPGWRGPPGKAVAHRGNARRPRPRLRCAAALGFPLSPVDRLDADAVDVDELATQPAPNPEEKGADDRQGL